MTLKTAWKLKSRKKIIGLAENRDTMDRGIHHGQTFLPTASVFFCSSLSSNGMVTGGIHGVIRMTFKGEFLIKKVSKPAIIIKSLYPGVKWNFWGKI